MINAYLLFSGENSAAAAAGLIVLPRKQFWNSFSHKMQSICPQFSLVIKNIPLCSVACYQHSGDWWHETTTNKWDAPPPKNYNSQEIEKQNN